MALTKVRGVQVQDLTITNANIALPDASNPDGILLTKIQDGDLLVKSDGSVPFTAPVSGVAPTAGTHLATKDYVDNVATGLDVKVSVRAISTTNIALSGTQTIDGVALVAGDRILVGGQTDASENGIYVVAAGAWARSADADNSPDGEVTSGMFTFVEEGGVNGGTGWVLTSANPIVLGTTDLVFTQFSSAGIIQAGAGLTKTGNVLDVVSANGGIVVNADNIALTVDPNGTLAVTSSGIKLADLASGKVLIGNVSNVATAVDLSGDVTITNAGVVTIADDAVTTNKILDAAVTTDKLADGAVTLGKIEPLSAGALIIGTAEGNSQVFMSGDATLSEGGVLTISNNAITTAKILDGAVVESKLATDSVSTNKIVNEAVTQDKIAPQAVGFNQLLTLGQAEIIIGTTGGNQAVVLSGDATMSQTGVVSINASTVVRVQDVITRETPAGTIDGSNVTFTLANTPKVGTEHVYVNGLLQDAGGANDYTISGAVITLNFALVSGDKIRVSYVK